MKAVIIVAALFMSVIFQEGGSSEAAAGARADFHYAAVSSHDGQTKDEAEIQRRSYRSGGYRFRPTPTAPARPATPRFGSTVRRPGGLFPFFGGFGLGALFGSMFHPFGGYYGGGFSIFGLLFDILLIYLAFKLLRRIFRRRY